MTNTNNSNSAKINIVCDGPYRMDWNSGKFVKIEPHTLEVGQLVTSHEYAMNTYEFVCISEAVNGVQQLVEIGGRHRRHNWVCRDNDRSTEQVFGIGLYYDPSGYRMPAEEIERHKRAADIQERWNARREENQRKADEKECRELREKWAGVLVPLSDIEDWKERDKQEKANFLNYLKHYHPHTKFTAKKSRGGGYYTISWQDGPTSSAIKTLCSVWHDHTFDGYTDYNEYTPTNFNKVFGGVTYSMDTNRSFSEAAKAAARADLLSICPEFAEYLGTGKDYRHEGVDDIPQHWLNITVNRHRDNPTARAIKEAGWREAANWNTINPDRILIDYLDAQDLTPAEDTTPTDPKPRKNSSSTDTATDTDEAPAEGLELVEIVGGVAVVGDSRTTYRNRKAIKAHGATWNKAAQQWQATDPEAVAALRAWFGIDDDPTPEPDPTGTDPTEQKTDSQNTDTPTGQKCPAPLITTADTSDPAAMKEAAENVREWCNTDQLTDPTPYAAEFDNVAALAWAVLNNYTPTEAEQMTAAALQLSAKMQRRSNEINEATAAMEEANRQESDTEQWKANSEEIEEFAGYAEELAMYAEGLAAAVGVPDWQLCDVAAIPGPQDDPAQLTMALTEEKPNTPTQAAPVTDAEVYEQSARIRATYEALKAEAETPSNQKTDTTPSNQKSHRLPAVKERKPRAKHSALCRSMLRNMSKHEKGKLIKHGVNLADPSLTVCPKSNKQSTARILKEAQKEGYSVVLVEIYPSYNSLTTHFAWLIEGDKWGSDTTKGIFDEYRRDGNTKLYLVKSKTHEVPEKDNCRYYYGNNYDPFERLGRPGHDPWMQIGVHIDKSGYRLVNPESRKQEAHRYCADVRRKQEEAAFNTATRDEAIKKAQSIVDDLRIMFADFILNGGNPHNASWEFEKCTDQIKGWFSMEEAKTDKELQEHVEKFNKAVEEFKKKIQPEEEAAAKAA